MAKRGRPKKKVKKGAVFRSINKAKILHNTNAISRLMRKDKKLLIKDIGKVRAHVRRIKGLVGI
jgi:hypothetical protein